jgi:hypothetical protein
VGPRAGLDAVAKKKILSPSRESNPCRPARSLVAIPTELWLFLLQFNVFLYFRSDCRFLLYTCYILCHFSYLFGFSVLTSIW